MRLPTSRTAKPLALAAELRVPAGHGHVVEEDVALGMPPRGRQVLVEQEPAAGVGTALDDEQRSARRATTRRPTSSMSSRPVLFGHLEAAASRSSSSALRSRLDPAGAATAATAAGAEPAVVGVLLAALRAEHARHRARAPFRSGRACGPTVNQRFRDSRNLDGSAERVNRSPTVHSGRRTVKCRSSLSAGGKATTARSDRVGLRVEQAPTCHRRAAAISTSQPSPYGSVLTSSGCDVECLVTRDDLAGDGRVDLRHALRRLDLTEGLARRSPSAPTSGRRHEHDVAESVLRVVGDADPDVAVVAGAHPLVLAGVLEVARGSRRPPEVTVGCGHGTGRGRASVTRRRSGRKALMITTRRLHDARMRAGLPVDGVQHAAGDAAAPPASVRRVPDRREPVRRRDASWPSTTMPPSPASTTAVFATIRTPRQLHRLRSRVAQLLDRVDQDVGAHLAARVVDREHDARARAPAPCRSGLRAPAGARALLAEPRRSARSRSAVVARGDLQVTRPRRATGRRGCRGRTRMPSRSSTRAACRPPPFAVACTWVTNRESEQPAERRDRELPPGSGRERSAVSSRAPRDRRPRRRRRGRSCAEQVPADRRGVGEDADAEDDDDRRSTARRRRRACRRGRRSARRRARCRRTRRRRPCRRRSLEPRAHAAEHGVQGGDDRDRQVGLQAERAPSAAGPDPATTPSDDGEGDDHWRASRVRRPATGLAKRNGGLGSAGSRECSRARELEAAGRRAGCRSRMCATRRARARRTSRAPTGSPIAATTVGRARPVRSRPGSPSPAWRIAVWAVSRWPLTAIASAPAAHSALTTPCRSRSSTRLPVEPLRRAAHRRAPRVVPDGRAATVTGPTQCRPRDPRSCERGDPAAAASSAVAAALGHGRAAPSTCGARACRRRRSALVHRVAARSSGRGLPPASRAAAACTAATHERAAVTASTPPTASGRRAGRRTAPPDGSAAARRRAPRRRTPGRGLARRCRQAETSTRPDAASAPVRAKPRHVAHSSVCRSGAGRPRSTADPRVSSRSPPAASRPSAHRWVTASAGSGSTSTQRPSGSTTRTPSVVSTSRSPAASTTARIDGALGRPRRRHRTAEHVWPAGCGRRSRDSVSLVRATSPSSRTNAAMPSTAARELRDDEPAAAVAGEDHVRLRQPRPTASSGEVAGPRDVDAVEGGDLLGDARRGDRQRDPPAPALGGDEVQHDEQRRGRRG